MRLPADKKPDGVCCLSDLHCHREHSQNYLVQLKRNLTEHTTWPNTRRNKLRPSPKKYVLQRRIASPPFTLLTGAGCSKSAGIPLAGELVAEMNGKPKYALHLNPLSKDEKKDYTKCMAKLSKNHRKALLTPYLDNAKINWAHIAIATLIKAG